MLFQEVRWLRGRRVAQEIIQLIRPDPIIRPIKEKIEMNSGKVTIRPCNIKDAEILGAHEMILKLIGIDKPRQINIMG